jgi:hypothetical protein
MFLMSLDLGSGLFDFSTGFVVLGLGLGFGFVQLCSDCGETRFDVCFDSFEVGLGLDDCQFAVVERLEGFCVVSVCTRALLKSSGSVEFGLPKGVTDFDGRLLHLLDVRKLFDCRIEGLLLSFALVLDDAGNSFSDALCTRG